MKPDLIFNTISTLKEKMDKRFTGELAAYGVDGLAPSHGSILMMLVKADGQLKMKDLTGKVNRTKSTVSELVNKLESGAYVTRSICTVDGRVCYVKLTHKGRELEKIISRILKDVNSAIYEGFNAGEKQALTAYLERINLNLE